MADYSERELVAIYELGRLYFEMGYFSPAERIFQGLSVVDGNLTPAKIGLGLLRLERGLYDDAATYFRQAVQAGLYDLEARIGLCLALIAQNDFDRGASIHAQIRKDLEDAGRPEGLMRLWKMAGARLQHRK